MRGLSVTGLLSVSCVWVSVECADLISDVKDQVPNTAALLRNIDSYNGECLDRLYLKLIEEENSDRPADEIAQKFLQSVFTNGLSLTTNIPTSHAESLLEAIRETNNAFTSSELRESIFEDALMASTDTPMQNLLLEDATRELFDLTRISIMPYSGYRTLEVIDVIDAVLRERRESSYTTISHAEKMFQVFESKCANLLEKKTPITEYPTLEFVVNEYIQNYPSSVVPAEDYWSKDTRLMKMIAENTEQLKQLSLCQAILYSSKYRKVDALNKMTPAKLLATIKLNFESDPDLHNFKLSKHFSNLKQVEAFEDYYIPELHAPHMFGLLRFAVKELQTYHTHHLFDKIIRKFDLTEEQFKDVTNNGTYENIIKIFNESQFLEQIPRYYSLRMFKQLIVPVNVFNAHESGFTGGNESIANDLLLKLKTLAENEETVSSKTLSEEEIKLRRERKDRDHQWKANQVFRKRKQMDIPKQKIYERLGNEIENFVDPKERMATIKIMDPSKKSKLRRRFNTIGRAFHTDDSSRLGEDDAVSESSASSTDSEVEGIFVLKKKKMAKCNKRASKAGASKKLQFNGVGTYDMYFSIEDVETVIGRDDLHKYAPENFIRILKSFAPYMKEISYFTNRSTNLPIPVINTLLAGAFEKILLGAVRSTYVAQKNVKDLDVNSLRLYCDTPQRQLTLGKILASISGNNEFALVPESIEQYPTVNINYIIKNLAADRFDIGNAFSIKTVGK